MKTKRYMWVERVADMREKWKRVHGCGWKI